MVFYAKAVACMYFIGIICIMKQHLHKSRRLTVALLVALFTSTAWAEFTPIDLTFSGRGESANVQKVTVTNLSHPEIAPVTLSGTDILRLADEETITPIESVEETKVISEPILTPNPAEGDGTLIFDAKQDGSVHIGIYTTSGMFLEAATLNVSKGRNTARIPSQGKGIYIVNVEGQGVNSSTRWICNGSKSFSGIALGGAQQWGETNLSKRSTFKAPAQRKAAELTDVVLMQFTPGDILRFEGTSGKMRTIMHMAPESSHAITFDFFKCEDANGYNYPIVRIGDMLWMLEDLRPQNMNGLTKTSSANIWKEMGDYEAAEFVVGDRAYYTTQGGRLAMPEGWEMPSLDEIYGMVKDLGNDSLNLGDFLKDRDTEWPKPLIEGPDTLHLQLMANGFVNRDGELISDEVTGAWPTRTTISHGCPATFEISALNSRFRPLIIHDKRCALTVRGCRPAPSVYQEMLQQIFQTNEESNNTRRKIPMQLVNSNGPLGSYYTYGSDRNSIFFDFSMIQYNSSVQEKRSGVLYKNKNKNQWLFESKGMVPMDVNNTSCTKHLRKVTAQGNADGYENVVYASWSRPFRQYFSGDKVYGEGVVNITIYGDSTKNHATLDGYTTRPLLDADGNEYKWTMPCYTVTDGVFDNGDRQFFRSEVGVEYYARAFNLKCIQDETGDGVDEIVMNVSNKIAVFDGATLRCIREQVYADEGSDVKTPNLRFDVADVNGDGYEDIVLLLNKSVELGYLYVYSQGRIDQEPVFTKILGSSCFFCDVKVGNLSGNELPEIAFLTRGGTNSWGKLQKTGYLYVSRLEYDEDMKLKEKVVLPRTSVDCFAANDNGCFRVGNMDLVFGYFRGHNYNQDLVVGDGLWRFDDELQKPTYRFQIIPSVKTTNSVPADAIMAVQTREDDIESLVYIWVIPIGVPQKQARADSPYSTVCEFVEAWLSDNGNKANYANSFATELFGWGNVGDCYSGWKTTELIRWYQSSSSNEFNSHPVLCKFEDRERAKHFRFISHEVTFSEPRIYAAIAAAPYYKDLDGSDNAETSWGKNSSDGTNTSRSDTWGGSIIAGYEHSYSAPFLSSMKAGVEFTAKVTANAGIATGHEETTTYGQSYSAIKDHVVVMQAMPYDTYTYEIIGSDEPDDLGAAFIVSMPRTRRFVGVKLEDYVRLTADQKGVAKPQRHLTATAGVPSSYPVNYNSYPMLVDKKHPFLQGRDLNGDETLEMVGTGGTTTRSISLATSDYDSNSVEVGVETELVATIMGVKAGVGFNYNHTNESTHTIGEEFAVSGTVPGLPSLNDPKHPQFRWNLVWYYVQDGKEIYPVVNYCVRPF